MSWFGSLWPWGTSHKTAAPSQDRTNYAGTRSRNLDEDTGMGRGGREAITLSAYDQRRNNHVAAAIGKCFSDNVLGPRGLIPHSTTSDPVWNKRADEYLLNWYKVADYRRRETMRGLQGNMIDARLWSGDMFLLLTDSGQLQPVEGLRVKTPAKLANDPQVVDGIRLTPEGIALGYYIHERKNGALDPDNYAYREAANVVHIKAKYWRSDCLRPPAETQDVLAKISDLDDLQNAILRRARAEAGNGAVVTTAEGAGKISGIASLDRGNKSTAEQIGTVHEKIDGWKTFYLRPGEDVKHPSLSAPGGNYVPYIIQQWDEIGAALGVPGEYLRKHFDASFSASTVAIMQADNTFDTWEEDLRIIMQRIRNWRIAKAIKDGELDPAPVDERGFSTWWMCDWIGAPRKSIDPVKRANANRATFAMGIGSLQAMARQETGKSLAELFAEKKEAIRQAIVLAEELTKETGVKVTYGEIINLSSSISQDATPQPDPKPEPANAGT